MKPLADRMRPVALEQFQGQIHLLGADRPVRNFLATGSLPSIIFWGPPGSGKTTLARLMASLLDRPFCGCSAVHAGVREVREIIKQASATAAETQDARPAASPVLFIDEIHRFSKNQQDALLGAVEEGVITLLGATTENPSFEVIPALLSRCQVYVIEPLEDASLLAIARRALKEDVLLAERDIALAETASLLRLAAGDARKLLNVIEMVVCSQAAGQIVITDELVQRQAQKHFAHHDKDGEQHHDLISAFIKSVRGSDPNAAVYYLARMIAGGEDPLFIARRLVILASEDIGNANHQGLVVANSCFQAVHAIGMPEGGIVLSQCATYLACSPKSNASYKALKLAMEACNEAGSLPVPLHLRNAPTDLMRRLHYGEGYKYAHDYEQQFVELDFLPEHISGNRFYEPGDSRWERAAREFLRLRWRQKYGY